MCLKMLKKNQTTRRRGVIISVLALSGVMIPVVLNGDSLPLQSAKFPSKEQLLAFIAANIDWYRHFSTEQQIATDPADLLFLEDNRSISEQAVKLSFDFARSALAYAAAVETTPEPDSRLADPVAGPIFQNLISIGDKAETAVEQSEKNGQQLQQLRASARGAARDRLDIEVVDAQTQVKLLRSMSATLHGLREFVHTKGAGQSDSVGLAAFVDGLEQTLPDAGHTNPGSAASVPIPGSSSTVVTARTPSGIPGRISRVSALSQKLRIVDECVSKTDQLEKTSQSLLVPLEGELSLALKNVGLLNVPSASDDLSALRQQQSRLDALMAETSNVSTAVTALARQRVLLTVYRAHLDSWRAAIVRQYRSAWKDVAVLLSALLIASALVIAASVIVRRLTSLHVHDENRRHVIMIGQRIMLWLSFGLILAVTFSWDLRSFATFIGIASAGVAVVMQNVILAVIGYFLLVGKLHVRVGDRIDISGVRGEVVEIGLVQFRLRELGESGEAPTGRVVSFSNSFVFLSPATGLFKHGHVPEDKSDHSIHQRNDVET